MNYQFLTKPNSAAIKKSVLGHDVFFRRLTTQELNDYDRAIAAVPEGDERNLVQSRIGIELFLSALVNEDGTTPKKSELPSVDDLLASHAPGDLLEAVITVQNISWGTLEDAKKN